MAVVALGIGLNIVGFGSINALWLSPLPYPDAHQLVGLNERAKGSSGVCGVSLANFFDWRDRQHVFSALAAFYPTRVSLAESAEAETVNAVTATADFFTVLGVAPVEGRTFLPEDAQPGAPPVVVLSDNLWRSRFQAAPMVGSTVRVDGVPTTVIGIMPPEFGFPRFAARTQLYLPLTANRAALQRWNHSVWAVARLHPRRTLDEARAEMQVIGDRLAREYPTGNADIEPMLMPLRHLFLDSDKIGRAHV